MYNQFMTELRVREAAALNVRERVREMKIDRKLVKPHYGHAAKWEYLSLARNQELEFPISGFASFPPTAVIACLKTDHHGLESLVGVIKGRPM